LAFSNDSYLIICLTTDLYPDPEFDMLFDYIIHAISDTATISEFVILSTFMQVFLVAPVVIVVIYWIRRTR